jgi:AcrR family transcriptional regulator
VPSKAADPGSRGSAEGWLDAAYKNLIESGVDSVRIALLSERLKLSRTSFYWFFQDRDAVLKALLERWRSKNTRNLIRQTQVYAESINEAILNVFDCWLNPELFDSEFEFSVRTWAQQSSDVSQEIAAADKVRLQGLRDMFIRFDYKELAADVRARTIYLTQIGYISMQASETLATRMGRIPSYVEIFTSIPPTQGELQRFFARHGYCDPRERRKSPKYVR